MARGALPSMTALLGLLAVAGFQNREKLGELLGNRASPGSGDRSSSGGGQALPSGLGGILSGLSGAAGGGLGGLLGGGLGELTERFRQNGHGEAVDSWVSTGPNRNVEPHQLEQALGQDTLEELTQHTGLSREELLARLSRELPKAVDQYTPEGRLPSDDVRGS